MKNNKRAIRRSHQKRLSRKRANYLIAKNCVNEKQLAKLVNTPKPCSCYMCGNPRKYFNEITIHEKKWQFDSSNQITDNVMFKPTI